MTGKNESQRSRRHLTHKEAVELALNDPVAQAATASNPRVIRARQLYAEAGHGLFVDLAEAGFGVESMDELRRQVSYQAAVPILLNWLPRVRYLPLAEDIVRTLSASLAKKQVLPEFLGLFRDPPEVENQMRPATSEPARDHLRWVIGNGLGILAGPAVADELIELALDRKYGQARTQIVLALPKTKDERVPQVLLSMLDDPDVAAFAIEALGKMRSAGARERIEGMLGSSDKNVRDQAKKAIKRIGG